MESSRRVLGSKLQNIIQDLGKPQSTSDQLGQFVHHVKDVMDELSISYIMRRN